MRRGSRLEEGLDGTALVRGGVTLGGLIEGEGRSKTLPGSIWRFQMRSMRSGRTRRTVRGAALHADVGVEQLLSIDADVVGHAGGAILAARE